MDMNSFGFFWGNFFFSSCYLEVLRFYLESIGQKERELPTDFMLSAELVGELNLMTEIMI